MSIYIKDMKMPKVPGVYSLDLYVDEICQIQNLDGRTFEAIELSPRWRMMNWHIWHNTRGFADEYFIVKKYKVYWKIPQWLGRLLKKESE